MAFERVRRTQEPDLWDAEFVRAVEAEISRFQTSKSATFASGMERRYERDTHDARTQSLQLTMVLGGICFLLTSLTDIAFVPDIGWRGVLMRVAAFPLFLMVIVLGPGMEPLRREVLMVTAGVVLVALLAFIPLLSSAPQAALSFMCAIFAVAFGNTAVVPRFRHACIFTALCVVVIGALAIWQGPFGWAITIELVLVAVFTLFANYRIERGDRLEYLLGLYHAKRAADLNADREKLKELAETDALTGVPNRAAFNNYCAALYDDPANDGRQVVLLLADVDYFKDYNDHYGHVAGDLCLKAIAEKLAGTLRNRGDLVARFGGEEFVACILDVGGAHGEAVARRMCDGVRSLKLPHANRKDGDSFVSISIGVATGRIEAGSDIDELVEAADKALYAAKRNGRNRIEISLQTAA